MVRTLRLASALLLVAACTPGPPRPPVVDTAVVIRPDSIAPSADSAATTDTLPPWVDDTATLTAHDPLEAWEQANPDYRVEVADTHSTRRRAGYAGRLFGPFHFWASYKDLTWGPDGFTGGQNSVSANGICTLIASSRARGLRLITTIGGGGHTQYLTGGKFDFNKWRNVTNAYNTTAVKACVRDGVADGTVIANILMDEPEHYSWGGVMTKPLIDKMADYVRSLGFTTLPMGVGHGPPAALNWRAGEYYTKLDFVYYQYNWNVRQRGLFERGEYNKWRAAMVARVAKENAVPALGINIVNGGVQDNDNDGKWECPSPLTQGQGGYYPHCRTTAAQVKTWLSDFAPYACYVVMWEYNDGQMRRSDNQASFAAVGQVVRALAPRSCKR
jgi:hypothetical protein